MNHDEHFIIKMLMRQTRRPELGTLEDSFAGIS